MTENITPATDEEIAELSQLYGNIEGSVAGPIIQRLIARIRAETSTSTDTKGDNVQVMRHEPVGWRDISTAPKDGTRILIWFVHANAQYSKDPIGEGWEAAHEAQWIDHNGGGWTWHGLCGVATYWRPIPTLAHLAPEPSELQITDAMVEYRADQWWVKELEALWGEGKVTDDTRRAAKVACDFIRAALATREG